MRDLAPGYYWVRFMRPGALPEIAELYDHPHSVAPCWYTCGEEEGYPQPLFEVVSDRLEPPNGTIQDGERTGRVTVPTGKPAVEPGSSPGLSTTPFRIAL